MTLFVNSCIGPQSRTLRIAKSFLRDCRDVEEVVLADMQLVPMDAQTLDSRSRKGAVGDFSDPYFDLAKQFAAADEIVIAAPFWDLSFPAMLKTYLEHVCITGLTFRYSEQGFPVGMCRAKKLTFVTTAGGPFVPSFGYEYIRSLATVFFGIPEVSLIYAEKLDIVGNDPEAIVEACIATLTGGKA